MNTIIFLQLVGIFLLISLLGFSLLCYLEGTIHFHKYSKWEDVSVNNIMRNIDGKDQVVGRSTYQSRNCKECNKLQMRRVVVR